MESNVFTRYLVRRANEGCRGGHDDNEAPASKTAVQQKDNDWVHVWNKKKTVKGESKKIRNTMDAAPKTNSFELQEVFAYKEEEDGNLWITVGSGGSENVIPGNMAPQFEVKQSK